jgi:hypothetical protein
MCITAVDADPTGKLPEYCELVCGDYGVQVLERRPQGEADAPPPQRSVCIWPWSKVIRWVPHLKAVHQFPKADHQDRVGSELLTVEVTGWGFFAFQVRASRRRAQPTHALAHARTRARARARAIDSTHARRPTYLRWPFPHVHIHRRLQCKSAQDLALMLEAELDSLLDHFNPTTSEDEDEGGEEGGGDDSAVWIDDEMDDIAKLERQLV